MVIKEIPFGSDQYEAMRRFREKILRVPIGLTLSEADLKGEDGQMHIAAVLEDGSIAGTALLKPLSSRTVKLRQMAISPSLQGKGLGRRMVLFVEARARKLGYETIELNARVYAQPFYEKLGYRAEGSRFIEVTLPTVRMVKRIV
jgi:GNAT superfamily N-acetyltransferase